MWRKCFQILWLFIFKKHTGPHLLKAINCTNRARRAVTVPSLSCLSTGQGSQNGKQVKIRNVTSRMCGMKVECEKIIVSAIREAWDQKGILSEQIRTEELSFLKKIFKAGL